MYQSVNSQRYGKAKGMKVKHLVQLVALTVLFTWFLYQLNGSHKAKILSLRAEKEDDVDDELLITSDNDAGSGFSGGKRVDIDEGADVAHEDFIDRKSVVKSRKVLRPVDTTELEQINAEGDRVDDVFFDDSGEGAGDEKANSDKSVRLAEIETEREKEVAVGDHERAIETEEGEDGGADNVRIELDVSEERTGENLTKRGGGDVIEDTGESTEKEFENKAMSNPSKTVTDDIPDKAHLAESEQFMTLKSGEVEKNLTKEGNAGTEYLQVTKETKPEEMKVEKNLQDNKIGSASVESLAETGTNSSKVERVESLDEESNVSEVFPRSPHESSQRPLSGPLPSIQNGAVEKEDLHVKLPAHTRVGQRSGIRDSLRKDSSVDGSTVTAVDRQRKIS